MSPDNPDYEAMIQAFLGAEPEADNSAAFSEIFNKRLQKLLENEVITVRMAESINSCETEEQAQRLLNAAIVGLETANNLEKQITEFHRRHDELMASFQGDLTPEQNAEYSARLKALEDEYLENLRTLEDEFK